MAQESCSLGEMGCGGPVLIPEAAPLRGQTGWPGHGLRRPVLNITSRYHECVCRCVCVCTCMSCVAYMYVPARADGSAAMTLLLGNAAHFRGLQGRGPRLMCLEPTAGSINTGGARGWRWEREHGCQRLARSLGSSLGQGCAGHRGSIGEPGSRAAGTRVQVWGRQMLNHDVTKVTIELPSSRAALLCVSVRTCGPVWGSGPRGLETREPGDQL